MKIYMIEGEKARWRQYFVITDSKVVVVEMVPALLFGWNVERVSIQGGESWPDMSEAQIIAFKSRTLSGCGTEITGDGFDKIVEIVRAQAPEALEGVK